MECVLLIALSDSVGFRALPVGDRIKTLALDVTEDVLYDLAQELEFVAGTTIDDKGQMWQDFAKADPSGYGEMIVCTHPLVNEALRSDPDESYEVTLPDSFTGWLEFGQEECLQAIGMALRKSGGKIRINASDISRDYVVPKIVDTAAKEAAKVEFYSVFPGWWDAHSLSDRINAQMDALGRYQPYDSGQVQYAIGWTLIDSGDADKGWEIIEDLAKQEWLPARYDIAVREIGDVSTFSTLTRKCRIARQTARETVAKVSGMSGSQEMRKAWEQWENKAKEDLSSLDWRELVNEGEWPLQNLRQDASLGYGPAREAATTISAYLSAIESLEEEIGKTRNVCRALVGKEEKREEQQRKKQLEIQRREEELRLEQERQENARKARLEAEEQHRKKIRETVREGMANVRLGGSLESYAPAQGVRKMLADTGDARVRVRIGYCVINGIGTPCDTAHGIALVQMGIKHGDMYGHAVLGDYYMNLGQYPEAVEEYRQGPRVAECLEGLARCYYEGWGVPKSVEEAQRLYLRSGSAEAIALHAYITYTIPRVNGKGGNGISEPEDKEVEAYRNAAERGSALAMVNYGDCMQMRKQPVEAERWYREALTVADPEVWEVAVKRLAKLGVRIRMPQIDKSERTLLEWGSDGMPTLAVNMGQG